MRSNRERDALYDWVDVADATERGFLLAVVVINVLFPLALFVHGLPEPWKVFDGEASPINWFSSVQCALLGAWALAVFVVTRLGRGAGCDPGRRQWPWLVLALGFFFVSFDERFEIHEKTRDLLLEPRGWFTEIPSFKAGDVVLLSYAAAGACLAWVLLRDLRRHRPSLVLFLAALVLIGGTAFQDSLELRIFRIRWVRHTQIVAEETGEIWAQALFAASLVLLFFDKLRSYLGALSGRGRAAGS